jgi:hypothetical protein
MPRYQFSLNTADGHEVGEVQSDTFTEALDALGDEIAEGTILEIGVEGFPPARFERVFSNRGGAAAWWPAANRLAA